MSGKQKAKHWCVDRPCSCPADAEAVRIFEEFWKPLVCDSRGRLSRNLLIKELADYAALLDQVPKVYDHITGGRISKPNTLASVVIAVATDCENETLAEVLKDEKEVWEAERSEAQEQAPVIDVAYVKLRSASLAFRGRHVLVCVPEGEFNCLYDADRDEIRVAPEHPLPADWIETALESVKTLLAREIARFPRLEPIKE